MPRFNTQVDEADIEGVVKLFQKGDLTKAKVNELRDYAKFHSE